MSVTGDAKLAVKKPPPPLQKPAIVAVARSAPVGNLPAALRIDTVRFGIVTAPQFKLKKLISARTTGPVIADVNVCASHVAVLKPAPWLPRVVFCWSMTGGLASLTSPGLTMTFTFVGTPVWKSACVVSVGHPLAGGAESERFCVVVPPSVTTIFDAEPVTNPGKLAVMVG